MTDWGELYREHVAALSTLAGGLSDEQLATTVPGTPEWTAHDVLAHLAGIGADAASGRMEGAPGPAWTARQVAERREVPTADLVAQLQAHQDLLAASTVDNPRPAVVFDIATHHADLHEAFGRPRLPARLWEPVLDAVAPGRFGSAGVPEEVDGYELFRGLFSRRSRAQMQAWGLPLSPEELDELCIFGPREDDQPLP